MEHARIEREELFMAIDGGKRTYTVADIEALPPGERAELIDGEMFIMEAPSITHQRIVSGRRCPGILDRRSREKNGHHL